MIRSMSVVGCLVLAVVCATGCEPETRKAQGGPEALGASARFQATIFEVRLPADGIGRLDAKALVASAATPADLEKALAALGKTTILYKVDQTVSLAKDTVTINKREPFVTASRVLDGGQTVNTIQYQEVGAMFHVAGQPAATSAAMDVTLRVEMSALTDSTTNISENVKAPTVRNIIMGHNGPVEGGRPVVMVSADASSKDAQGNAIAYVCRVVFGGAGS